MRMTGNTILITGGTRGIGRALAVAFQSRGNQVVVAGRSKPLLDDLAALHPGILGIQADAGDAADMARLSDRLRAEFPALNVLIANAGISRPERMDAPGWAVADAEAMIGTNILGVLRATAAALPVLRRNPHATIMATSSALAFVPRADFPTYCATKAFLHSWLRSLRHQLRAVPVEVLELSPPYVRTGLTGAQQASDPRAMPLDDFVAEVMTCLEQGHHPNGEILLPRDEPRRWAERDGTFDAVFAALNPS